VHNSTWQNLHTPGRRLENDFMNGEIVTLAERLGLTAPGTGGSWPCSKRRWPATPVPERSATPNSAAASRNLADPEPFREDAGPGR